MSEYTGYPKSKREIEEENWRLESELKTLLLDAEKWRRAEEILRLAIGIRQMKRDSPNPETRLRIGNEIALLRRVQDYAILGELE